MFKGFKEFLMRGNVIDLAVAVVVGSAFTALVTSFTTSIIKPVIAATGGGNVTGLSIQLREGNEASIIDFAAVINAVITFLITAAVVYFLFVLPMKTFNERRKKAETTVVDPTDVELLQEIRDLLRREQGLPAVTGLASESEKAEVTTDGQKK
ncbi:large conductance mechanosensitive channel [Saccharopolyspora kobensis]|uniref:Large-conductance mechanosensitive channel n=1 Tax=Saccharopolyspora kobensis TaxID=146035 RepID=A0A1H6D458_9PSEU|nr:large conductance mechanosensitive channel protein MscL [Saccharopolyspora kobensis]SEG80117.1 large conductance mechanosensitive channel [Saccharopolyspora kobensis]SFD10643.1 large conductance mechanosensitive channel [Saccharopolyspora kobensis]